MLNKFNNSSEAFEYLYDYIIETGVIVNDTKVIYNCGFEIQNPMDNIIQTSWRKFNPNYAQQEWLWYLSANPNATEIAKQAKIWYNMMDDNGNVNSNYGYQWTRNNQLQKVIQLLKDNPTTRKASISLYDGKEIDLYTKDTICTYAINFYIQDNRLNMQVLMRSNDLVFGFCNDQYCFSNLQKLVADELNIDVGKYYHFVCNMHIYERHYNIKKRQE